LHVEDLTDVLIDAFGLRQKLVERATSHDRPKCGLGDLADRGLDVLDSDHEAEWIPHAVITTADTSMLTLSLVMIPCVGGDHGLGFLEG
jgi:hypothetical protein